LFISRRLLCASDAVASLPGSQLSQAIWHALEMQYSPDLPSALDLARLQPKAAAAQELSPNTRSS
jgi:hypothetical protein